MDTRKKVAAGMAGFASMLWLGLTAAVAANQRRLVFNPTVEREVKSPRSSGHRTRPVVLRAADGTRLCGWLMTPKIPGRTRPSSISAAAPKKCPGWCATPASSFPTWPCWP
jgi:hypothetical protein